MSSPKRVLVPLAQGCEELEAVTIIDLLVRGGIDVTTASLDDNQLITASRGVMLVAQTTLSDVLGDHFDMVVLPGGLSGADLLEKDPGIIKKLQSTVEKGGDVGAICAAPKALIKAGLLDDKQATGYPGIIDKAPASGMTYIDQPVVVDGSIITSRGPGTAIDFALTLIERLQGVDIRDSVEQALVRS